nr:hypothetical protein [Tanacetum cinerariifolium]
MNLIVAQRFALDNALVAPENRVQIGKCNMRIDPTKTPKEPTYQVFLYALALTTCYPAFLITADVLEIYMHQLWHTITKIKNSSSYKFKLDKKKCTIDVDVFRDILYICPRLLNQEFVVPPSSNEEIVSFIKELGYTEDINSVTKTLDFVELLWEDFMFQIDNKDSKKQEKMYYPRFTKEIIHHFISKDKSIFMRNRLFMHTVQHDGILGSLRFVSKTEEYQVYGALIRAEMTNRKMQNSTAYKTYLAFATGAATPKKARKFKKPASLSKKETLVTVKEPAEKPAARRYEGDDLESGIPDEPKGKSIDTSEGTGLKPGVLNVSKADSFKSEYESWGDSDDENDDDDQQSDDEITESDDDKSVYLKKTYDEEETQYDEFVHTPEDYVPTYDETDDEEYDHINKEMYDDVNVELRDAEPADEGKDDEEMTQAGHVDSKEENVNQEVAAICVAIKSKVPTIVKEYLGTSQDDTLHKKRTLFDTMTKTKSFNKNTKHKALYHAFIESILKDEDAMDKGVADKSKKKNPDDADKDEGPPAGSNQGLKGKKISKDVEPSKKEKSIETSKGTTKSQLKSTSKSAQAEETVFEAGDTQVLQNQEYDMGNTDEPSVVNVNPKDWFKKPERPPTPDLEWNEYKAIDNKPTQKWLRPAYQLLKGTCRSYIELEYNMEECYKALNDQLDWNNPEGDRYPFNLSKPLPLVQSRNRQIVPVDYFFNNDLAYMQGGSTGRTYTTSLTKTKVAKYDLLTYVHKTYCDPEASGRSLSDKLKYMLNNLEMGYTSVMPRRRWRNLDKKRSRIMAKDIDRQLLKRRLMRSLEKFVGETEYGENLRLLQQTI